MNDTDTLGYYRIHGPLTEPGRFAGDFAKLPSGLSDLCRFIQGVVLHSDWAAAYGVQGGAALSRDTLPVVRRMALVEAAGAGSLPPARRTPGTCRDFALMLCSLLRERAVSARVRCGFAAYFPANPFEDHWVCEYWKSGEGRWARADAQLDELQRRHLRVAFDATDLPPATFLNAGEAWTAWRAGKAEAADFGQGPSTGAWFLRVNLMRDLFALRKQEMSPWDSWRSATPESKVLDDSALAAGDLIAEATRQADGRALDLACEPPPWSSAVS